MPTIPQLPPPRHSAWTTPPDCVPACSLLLQNLSALRGTGEVAGTQGRSATGFAEGRCPVRRASAARSSCKLNGFLRYPSTRARRARRASCSELWPVRTSTGASESVRNRSTRSSPCSRPRTASRMMAAIGRVCRIAHASRPDPTACTTNESARAKPSVSQIAGSSSTTRTFAPVGRIGLPMSRSLPPRHRDPQQPAVPLPSLVEAMAMPDPGGGCREGVTSRFHLTGWAKDR
jgi:hypothetical protein